MNFLRKTFWSSDEPEKAPEDAPDATSDVEDATEATEGATEAPDATDEVRALALPVFVDFTHCSRH